MGKLYDNLQKQLKTEYKKEAEDCIKIYNVLKAISREKYGEEHVWSSDWNVLTTTMLVGSYPNVRKMYKPSHIGKVFLIGILFDESGEIKLWNGFLYILVRVILTNPTSFIYNTDPPCKSKVDFYEIRKAIRSLYTEEQLFEYFYSIAQWIWKHTLKLQSF